MRTAVHRDWVGNFFVEVDEIGEMMCSVTIGPFHTLVEADETGRMFEDFVRGKKVDGYYDVIMQTQDFIGGFQWNGKTRRESYGAGAIPS